MFNKILGTGGTRILNALCSFVILWLGTNYLGAAEWGLGAIVLLDVTLILIAVELFAGSGLVYFVPRKHLGEISIISFAWIIIVIAFFAATFYILSFFPSLYHRFVPEGFGPMILLLVLVYSINNFNLNVFLGQGRVSIYNILFMVQFLSQLATMVLAIFVFDIRTAWASAYSLLAGNVIAASLGTIILLTKRHQSDIERDNWQNTIKEMFRYGSVLQLSTLVHTLNKRLSFFFLDNYCNKAAVGVYSSGAQVSESVKLIGHSISLVQLSSISNSNDPVYAKTITLQLLKVTVILTAIALLILVIIPVSVYDFVFGRDFSEMKTILILLSPGMLMLAANTIFSHYFAGVGKPRYNFRASVIGLLVTLPSVYFLIPAMGIHGACLAAVFTYIITVLYQWYVFKRDTGCSAKELIPNKTDWRQFVGAIRSFVRR